MCLTFFLELYLFPGVVGKTIEYNWVTSCLILLLLSCSLAPVVSISFYFVLQRSVLWGCL